MGEFHSQPVATECEPPLGKSLTSLVLYFLISRMGITTLTSQGCSEMKECDGVNASSHPCSVSQILETGVLPLLPEAP